MPSLFLLLDAGQSSWRIIIGASATPVERHAAAELQTHLRLIGGAELPIATDASPRQPHEIWVGASNRWSPVAAGLNPAPGAEGFIIRTGADHLLLAGEGRRGTLYAVYDFLERHLGCRWFTPGVSHIPQREKITLGPLDEHRTPAFEYREPYAFEAMDPDWAARNKCNGHFPEFAPHHGGGVRYALPFVHTFNELVPVEKYFDSHPEYFSEVKGVRVRHETQLCLSHPDVLALAVARIRAWLAANLAVSIVSVSQNDWDNPCQCAACRAVDAEEGNYSGSLIRFVNRIAEAIEPDYPHVAVDTLAYQYTRKPPRTVRPRPNVIVRLCSIECNFREPLDHPSNAAFADDIRGWSKICQRLYVWDYTTDFAHYVQPHPNWYVLGPNLRFFHQHHVRGMFEQGAYQSHGSEFAELRAWVLAQLLWNPFQDDRALIREFLRGYYGEAAAPVVQEYLDLMHRASEGWNLTCFSRTETPFHEFKFLAEAEKVWDRAETAAAGSSEHLQRLRSARQPLRYVWLARWDTLQKQCADAGATWPLPGDKREVAEAFRNATAGSPDTPWTKVTHLNESGLTVEKFLQR